MKNLILFIINVITLSVTLIVLSEVYSVGYGGRILVTLSVLVWSVTAVLMRKK